MATRHWPPCPLSLEPRNKNRHTSSHSASICYPGRGFLPTRVPTPFHILWFPEASPPFHLVLITDAREVLSLQPSSLESQSHSLNLLPGGNLLESLG